MFIRLHYPLIKYILTMADEFEKYRFINFTATINKYVKNIFESELFLWQLFIKKYPEHIEEHKHLMLASKNRDVIVLGLSYCDNKKEAISDASSNTEVLKYHLEDIGIPKKYLKDKHIYFIYDLYACNYSNRTILCYMPNIINSNTRINFVLNMMHDKEKSLMNLKNPVLIKYYTYNKGNDIFKNKTILKIYLQRYADSNIIKLANKSDIIDIIYALISNYRNNKINIINIKLYIKYIMKEDYNKIKNKPIHYILKYFFIYVNDIRWKKIFMCGIDELMLWALPYINIKEIPTEIFLYSKSAKILNIGVNEMRERNDEEFLHDFYLYEFPLKTYNKLSTNGLITLKEYYHADHLTIELLNIGWKLPKISYDVMYYIVKKIKLLRKLLNSGYNNYNNILCRIKRVDVLKYFLAYCCDNKIDIDVKIRHEDKLDIIKLKAEYLYVMKGIKYNYSKLLSHRNRKYIDYALSMGAIYNETIFTNIGKKKPLQYVLEIATNHGIKNFDDLKYYDLYSKKILDEMIKRKLINHRELISKTDIRDIRDIKSLLIWYDINK